MNEAKWSDMLTVRLPDKMSGLISLQTQQVFQVEILIVKVLENIFAHIFDIYAIYTTKVLKGQSRRGWTVSTQVDHNDNDQNLIVKNVLARFNCNKFLESLSSKSEH